jgi:hypothetical protein
MELTKEMLDKRICDVEEQASNPDTYRQFIRNSEVEFGLHKKDLDSMSNKDLDGYLNFLDHLWDK